MKCFFKDRGVFESFLFFSDKHDVDSADKSQNVNTLYAKKTIKCSLSMDE